MCGIVGYLGQRAVVPLIINSLRQLEYRGYDSSGIAFLNKDQQLTTYKASGKLVNLENQLPEGLNKDHPVFSGFEVGIGHIRWATHGAPNDVNAHPHVSGNGTLAVVHNGIIENYFDIRQALQAQGYTFLSETDTECVAHLLDANSKKHPQDFIAAIRQTLQALKGTFALCILNQHTPERLYAIRCQAPLVVGKDSQQSGFVVASDTVAMAAYTNQVLYLKDHELVEISPDGIRLFDLDGEPKPVAFQTIQTQSLLVDKKGYKHFMLKEIYEQPDVLRHSLSGRLTGVQAPITLFEAPEQQQAFLQALAGINRIMVIGCGTSFHAGLVGKTVIEQLVRIPVEVAAAGECRYANPIWDKHTLVVAISQSGETADTLASLRLATEAPSRPVVLTMTNRDDSSMARDSDWVLPVRAGVEVSVCATKSFLAQVAVLQLLALTLAEQRQTQPAEEIIALKTGLLQLPSQLEAMLADLSPYQALAQQYSHAPNMIFIARGVNYPVAMEGALKLKEISYIHAEGYSGSELKHGPIALLDASMPVVAVLAPGVVMEKMISNCQEAKARNAQLIGFTCEPLPDGTETIFDNVVNLPTTHELLTPLLTALPLQALAYYMAEALGKDVDQPRNLAKSVTVE
jgi:glutamine---fructose-6-phosphate transaminase (isomerizing)